MRERKAGPFLFTQEPKGHLVACPFLTCSQGFLSPQVWEEGPGNKCLLCSPPAPPWPPISTGCLPVHSIYKTQTFRKQS